MAVRLPDSRTACLYLWDAVFGSISYGKEDVPMETWLMGSGRTWKMMTLSGIRELRLMC